MLPNFLISRNFGSFLAHFGRIGKSKRQFWFIFSSFWENWQIQKAVLVHFGRFWFILGSFWAVLVHFWLILGKLTNSKGQLNSVLGSAVLYYCHPLFQIYNEPKLVVGLLSLKIKVL